jgi:crotonobetainyl-CoA:carnitine CoA-transferase CaiB-like acyl-CoA transferase
MLALEKIRVLDLTPLAPGQFCTMILGDFGAEVLKVEAPGAKLGPDLKGEESRKEAAYFPLDRNKKSMVLNLKAQSGREVLHRLAKQVDVIVEGFRPGVVKRLGIDYETISKINPKVVYCSLSGYGQYGPYRDFPGHDINYISMAGVLGLIGPSGMPPVIPMNLIGDFAGASLYGVIGILTALMARNETGKGQHVDVAYMEGAMSLLTFLTHWLFFRGVVPKRGETTVHGAYPYYGVYETKDGKYISIGCIEPHFWVNLCRLLGREDYIPYQIGMDHFLHGPEDKIWEEISSYLKQSFLTKTRDEWFELLIKNDIPAGKVYTLDEVFSDPHVIQRQMVLEIEHPTFGKIKQAGIVPKLSDTPGKVRTFTPLIGEHTEEVLKGLGYSHKEIESLRKEGTIG